MEKCVRHIRYSPWGNVHWLCKCGEVFSTDQSTAFQIDFPIKRGAK